MKILGRTYPSPLSDVRKWQEFLAAQGHAPGPIDGSFGLGTELATIAFQTAYGLLADGIVGNKTLAVAIARGFQPLAALTDAPPSGKVVTVKTIADGVTIYKLAGNEAVFFTSDLDVDADGSPYAYGPGNSGLDHNGNAQTPTSSGNWNPAVVVLDAQKQPVPQKAGDPAPGNYICLSSLKDLSKAVTDPRRYVDALTVPYIVLPGGTVGPAGMGDAALVIDLQTGKRVKCLVADAGPGAKTGEASILVAGILLDGLTPKQIATAAKNTKLKDLKCNPRNGGSSAKKRFRYIVFPGTAMTWPRSIAEIEARVDGALASLTAEQLLAITS